MSKEQWSAFSASLNTPPIEALRRQTEDDRPVRRRPRPTPAAAQEAAQFMDFFGAVTGQPGVSAKEVRGA